MLLYLYLFESTVPYPFIQPRTGQSAFRSSCIVHRSAYPPRKPYPARRVRSTGGVFRIHDNILPKFEFISIWLINYYYLFKINYYLQLIWFIWPSRRTIRSTAPVGDLPTHRRDPVRKRTSPAKLYPLSVIPVARRKRIRTACIDALCMRHGAPLAYPCVSRYRTVSVTGTIPPVSDCPVQTARRGADFDLIRFDLYLLNYWQFVTIWFDIWLPIIHPLRRSV